MLKKNKILKEAQINKASRVVRNLFYFNNFSLLWMILKIS